MKTLNKVEKYTNNHGTLSEIVEHNGSKFKITATLSNGSNKLVVEKMDSDGIFHFVLGRNDIEFEFTASYVSNRNKKEADLNTGADKMKTLIKKIY